ncbi:hypothetical protein KSP40_PGU019087 [Platanthera guangdongensis]|uniref:Uncharacterized protein n=1 Tax=Platanthera guangdongensis TaxID=2320717 RepID=A0ABR2MPT5_9ASPA
MDRVSAWVDSLDDSSFFPVDAEEQHDEATDEAAEANDFIQSLNSFSSVAHISSLGLKAIPSISAFVSLRSVNLSGNYIDRITPGFLPKCLHTLDLSRNKILNIDGLRDLERLKILNLSHNRISRIGHGLSSCTLIKELYLAGNKISNAEGFDRLQKLTVLDLSFNRMNTVKALSQLAANFNSLLIFNLIGKPIQAHLGDDRLKKALLSLLPRVAYLNKQPTDPRKIREITTNIVGRASIREAARSFPEDADKKIKPRFCCKRVWVPTRSQTPNNFTWHHRSTPKPSPPSQAARPPLLSEYQLGESARSRGYTPARPQQTARAPSLYRRVPPLASELPPPLASSIPARSPSPPRA